MTLAVVIEEAAGWRATTCQYSPRRSAACKCGASCRIVEQVRLEQAMTAVAWSLTLLPLTLGVHLPCVNGSWANPTTVVALLLSLVGRTALALVWRGRVRTSMTRPARSSRAVSAHRQVADSRDAEFRLKGCVLQL